MSEVKFTVGGEPPERKRGRGGRRNGVYLALLNTARANPGEWVKTRDPVNASAAGSIRSGRATGSAPKGAFEAQNVDIEKDPDTGAWKTARLWVRYVGK